MNPTLFFVYLINGLVLYGLVRLVALQIKNETVKKYFYPALLFKLICTICIGLFYTLFYQGGDITSYFESGTELSKLPFSEYIKEITSSTSLSDPQRSIYFKRIVSVLIFFTKSDFWLTSLYFSLISFFGSCYFIIQLTKIYSKTTLPAIIALFFFPSIVFWSSSIIKEAMAFGCLLYFIGYSFKLIHSIKFKWYEIPISILCLSLLILLKYYIAAAILPCLVLYFLMEIKVKISNLQWYSLSFFLAMAMVFGLHFMHPNFDPKWFFIAIEEARNSLIANSKPESIIQLYSGANILLAGVINFFILLISGFFRPALFESFHFPIVLAGIENTLLLFLFISRFFGKLSFEKKDLNLIIIVITYTTFLALLLSYSSPNFGTLSRFKIYFMPFFLILILCNHPFIYWFDSSKKIKTIV